MDRQTDRPADAERRGRSRTRPAQPTVRIGVGYDSHRFAAGSSVRLGGLDIPHDQSLTGHSDADAVAHAITDALLGAAGEGDIGAMFPDDDPANRRRDSIEMLREAVTHLRARGWRPANVDVTVVAEAPRLAPYRDAMRDALASALGLDRGAVSVKGKSNEGMGFIGRGEGIACIAVATIVPVTS